MYQDRINANLDDQVKRPSTAPPPAAGLWTNFSSGFGGLPAGFLDAAASTAELVHGNAQVLTATGTMTGQGMFALPTEQENADAEKARNQIALHGVDFKSATADALRVKSAQFMPDAQTTGQAGQILGGLTNFGGQAVAAGFGGPAGLIDLGVNRAMTKNDELEKQGVDFNTRAAVSAISGGTDAASMLLPLSGATRWIRAGKGAAGGVASSVASTEAQKLILEHQGYSSIASTMDPFDPVSLALSALVPAGFGAAFGHAVPGKVAKPHEPGPADFALTPAEQANSDAMEAGSIDSDIASLHAEIAKQSDAGARAVLQAELDRLTKQKQSGVVAAGLAKDPNNVAAARTLQVADAMDSTRLTPDDDLAGYTTHAQALESAADSIARGQPVEVSGIFGDRVTDAMRESRLIDDHIDDLETQRGQLLGDAGNFLEPGAVRDLRQQLSELQSQAPSTDAAAVKARAGELQGKNVSYKQALAAAQREADAAIADHQAQVQRLVDQLDAHARAAQAQEALSGVDHQLAAARARGAELEGPRSSPRRLALTMADAFGQLRAAREPASVPAATKPDHASFRAAKAEAEAAASGESGGTEVAQPATKPAIGEPKASTSETGPAPTHLAAAAAEMARLSPDMLVHLDGLEAPMRVGDLLEHLANEAKAEKRDAGLLQVAAQCALSFGTT